jgi:hypothetical protein
MSRLVDGHTAWTQHRKEFVELMARLRVLAPAQKRIYALEAAFSRDTPANLALYRPPLDPDATPAGALADLFTRADAQALVNAPALGPNEDDGDDTAISAIVRAHDGTRTYKGYPKLRHKRLDVLRPLLPPGLGAAVDDGQGVLRATGLVTCLFCCTRCELVLTPWAATAHHCDLGTLDDADELWLTYGCLADRFAPLALPWNYGGCLAYDEEASRAAVAIISALELDTDKLRAIYKHAAFACGAEHCRRVRMFSWLDAVCTPPIALAPARRGSRDARSRLRTISVPDTRSGGPHTRYSTIGSLTSLHPTWLIDKAHDAVGIPCYMYQMRVRNRPLDS